MENVASYLPGSGPYRTYMSFIKNFCDNTDGVNIVIRINASTARINFENLRKCKITTPLRLFYHITITSLFYPYVDGQLL